MRCPICAEPMDARDRRWAPFCSERCKLLDLARWLDGDYSVPGDPAPVPQSRPGEDDDSGE